jgi:hypothetical protein
MIGKLFERFGPLLCIIAGFVLLALEAMNYRRNHDVSIFWLAIAVTMMLIAGYELFIGRSDNSKPK